MKAIAYAGVIVAGGVGGGVFAILSGGGPADYFYGLRICVPIGLVLGGACAAFVAWLSKESK